MRRREFIALMAGTAAWPLGARGQQAERMRRIGVLMNLSESDLEARRLITAFREGCCLLPFTPFQSQELLLRRMIGQCPCADA
jgi:putative ABC transport system substrate-binding protein